MVFLRYRFPGSYWAVPGKRAGDANQQTHILVASLVFGKTNVTTVIFALILFCSILLDRGNLH
jgi:hypothetical protein